MKKYLLLALLSFIAVIDMADPEAVSLVKREKSEQIFVWHIGGVVRVRNYGFYHCPDEASGRLKTVGSWVADNERALK